MGFIDTSTFNNNSIVKALKTGNSTPQTVTNGINYGGAVNGQSNTTMSASQSLGNQTLLSIPTAVPQSSKLVESVTSASNYLRSALQSTLSTFDKSVDGLASGIGGRLAGIFGNTNSPKASTVSTRISDPVLSNLLTSKKPTATSFKVSGMEAGSQPITTGGTTTSGSGSAQMTGTSLVTLLNRLSLDVSTVKNLPNTIAGRFTTQRLTGLSSTVTGTSGSSPAGLTSGSVLSKATGTALGTTLGVRSGTTTATSSNDLASFIGNTSSISKALGGEDLSSYFVTNPRFSLTDVSGNPVDTNQSNVDVTTATAILKVVKAVGCSITHPEYLSSSQTSSAFGLGLILAALEGMKDLVDDLLNCSHASSIMGQQSLGRAFGEVSGSQIDIANSIIDRVDAPRSLQTPDLSISILSNPSLSAKNASTVDSVFTKLGTSTKEAMRVPGVSSDRYPVYDASLLSNIQPGFTNAVFQDSTLTDYFQGRQMVTSLDGSLVYI